MKLSCIFFFLVRKNNYYHYDRFNRIIIIIIICCKNVIVGDFSQIFYWYCIILLLRGEGKQSVRINYSRECNAIFLVSSKWWKKNCYVLSNQILRVKFAKKNVNNDFNKKILITPRRSERPRLILSVFVSLFILHVPTSPSRAKYHTHPGGVSLRILYL